MHPGRERGVAPELVQSLESPDERRLRGLSGQLIVAAHAVRQPIHPVRVGVVQPPERPLVTLAGEAYGLSLVDPDCEPVQRPIT